jgi:pilus assembly protein CpaE
MTQDNYQPNRRKPLATLAHYNLDNEEGASDASLKVLVVDRRGDFTSAIERAARGLEQATDVVGVPQPTRLIEQVHIESPDVVLIAPEEMTPTGLRRLAQIHRASPKTVIALTQGAAPISMTEAAACGASEVLSYPASIVKLRNALHRILETAEAVRGDRVVIREVPAPAPAIPVHVGPATAAAASGHAMVFTVTSPTGGCGKTFFATNLAAYLAGVTGGRVLLVDLDLQFGEVSLALGLRPQRTISELINEDNMLEAFPEYLVDHSSGYKVLSAPADPFAAELVGPREATKVLECARGLFDYVVVDTPPSLNEVVLAAFDQSRYLVVMATLDVPSLRNLRVFLETIERLKLPAEDVSCVLNKAEPDNGIDLAELLRVYPRGFAAVLPYSKEVSRSLNVGQPVLMVDPRADISVKLLEAGAKLVPASEVTNPGWGSRTGGKASWASRRKDRHVHTEPIPVMAQPPAQQQPVPQLPAHPGYRDAPAAAAAAWALPVPQPNQGSYDLDDAPEPEDQDAEAAYLPVPPQATELPWPPQDRNAYPAGPRYPSLPAGYTPDAYQQVQGMGQRGWLNRLFRRAGRHSSLNPPQAPVATYVPSPSIATQMRVGPPSGSSPGNPLAQAAHNGGPRPEPETSTLMFSGSRQTTPNFYGPQGRRERPSESPITNAKERRR